MDASEKNINPKIGLIVGNDWLKQCDRIPKVEQRVSSIYIIFYLKISFVNVTDLFQRFILTFGL